MATRNSIDPLVKEFAVTRGSRYGKPSLFKTLRPLPLVMRFPTLVLLAFKTTRSNRWNQTLSVTLDLSTTLSRLGE